MTSLLAVLLTSQAQAATPEGAVISNGTVQLGVTELGSLNYDCAGNADTGCPDPSATENVDEVGLRFVPLNIDSTSPGCLCEGWGIADATSGLTGFANEAAGDGNLTVDSFTSPSADRAISTVTGLRPGPARVPDESHSGLPAVGGESEHLHRHGHGHEHGHERAQRPALPAGHGLGRRADGVRRVRDRPGNIGAASVQLR